MLPFRCVVLIFGGVTDESFLVLSDIRTRLLPGNLYALFCILKLDSYMIPDGIHHVAYKDGIDIYMLVENEYPLSRGTLTLMLVAKLLVEQDSKMSRELLKKIFMQVERPRR
ncbi:hypothetical protein Tco_1082602 [Tanacetum coccineum]|uniref:Uncharacterized protein n=1 Tax=Tanacetum coccineum TaxID=301880 RepID=A0ABQ5I312_9ASTR